MKGHPLGRFLLIAGLWLLPPLTISLGTVALGLPEVLQTGMCPAAPPDVAAYPCTASDYLLRMTLGPWALLGHIALLGAWTFLLACGWVLVALVRSLRPSRAQPSRISEVDRD